MSRDPQPLLDPRELLPLLRRRARTILSWTVGALGIALLYLTATEPVYTAHALVLVDPADSSLLAPEAAVSPNAATLNATVESEVALLRSDGVLLETVRNLDLVSSPDFRPSPGTLAKAGIALGFGGEPGGDRLLDDVLKEVKEATEARRLGLTHLVQVTARSADPARAAALANGLVETYIDRQLRSKTESVLAGGRRLRDQLDAARARLSTSEEALDLYVERTVQGAATLANAEIPRLRLALSTAREERSALSGRIDLAETALRRRDWQQISVALEAEAVAELTRERTRIRRMFDAAEAGSGTALDLSAELSRLRSRLQEESRSEVSRLRSRLSDLDARAEETRQSLRRAVLDSELPSPILARLYELQQESDIARRQHGALLSRARQLEAEALVQVADSRLASPALVPADPSDPDVVFVLALAALLGAGLGGAAALAKERIFGGIESEAQLVTLSRGPVGSVLPSAQTPPGGNSVADLVLDAPLSPFAESLRRLRAGLDQGTAPPAGRARMLLVTSSVPEEGKTTTALALARTYSLAGQRTLLIDADLRRPRLHEALGLAARMPLGEALRAPDPEAGRLSALRLFDPRSVTAVLPGGAPGHGPTDQLLQGERFRHLLEEAMSRYDCVVVDSPPLIPVVDARYLAPLADAVVMCVGSGIAGVADIRRGYEQLEAALGGTGRVVSVLTRHDMRSEAYRYYDGYQTAG